MNHQVANTMIRELNPDEILAVTGGTQKCSYEVANRCYVWRDETIWEWFIGQVNRAAGL